MATMKTTKLLKRKTAAGVLGALLVLGACGAASAQTYTTPNQVTQEQVDRDKVTLKNRIQGQISTADANIDALKHMSDTDKGATKQRDEDLQKRLSDMRDHARDNLTKIDKASVNEWPQVKSSVKSDYKALGDQLDTATSITHVAPTGGTNQQPE
jgi:hypothetical protein